MFEQGGRYRHSNSLDVDIYVVKVHYPTPKRCIMKVLYINRNYQKGNMVIKHKADKVKFYPDHSMWRKV